MTALLLLALLVAGFAGYFSWAAHAIAHGASAWWFVVGAPITYFAPALLLVAIWFAATWFWRTPRPREARLDAVAMLRTSLIEAWTLAASWPLMAFHRLLMRDPAATSSDRPVLLIHGVLVNDGVWFFTRRRLRRMGIEPIYAMTYGPPFADIERFAEQLSLRIAQICAATGAERVLVVAHSMGGLVARAYLRRFGPRRLAKLVTIGTPHHGSVLAWSFPGRGLEQMRPGNAWLAELNRTEDAPSAVPITSIWSRHDNMVAPQSSCQLPCAQNVAFAGVGHNALLGDRRVIDLLAREVEADRTRRPAS
jgi:triacylglycerol esterase/lipase EstA (alpha/beta hydrolase family)